MPRYNFLEQKLYIETKMRILSDNLNLFSIKVRGKNELNYISRFWSMPNGRKYKTKSIRYGRFNILFNSSIYY